MLALKIRNSALLFYLVLSLFSCEYELENENINDIERPSQYHKFDISLLTEEDTIRVFFPVSLYYAINTFGLELYEGEITLGSAQWNINDKTGDIYINPMDYAPGIHELKLIASVKSGSGSIADKLGAEGYMLERTWLLLIDNRPPPELIPTVAVSEKGYLKISWPKCDQYNFKAYELEASLNNRRFEKTISNPDSTVFLDSLFVGGSLYFRVSARVYNSEYSHTWGQIISENVEYPKLLFQDLGLDSLRIYWEKSPFSCRYTLEKTSPYPHHLISASTTDTSFVISHPGFAMRNQYTLSTESVFKQLLTQYDIMKDYSYHVLGESIASNWPDFAYNSIENVVYTNTYDDIICHDAVTTEILNSKRIDGLIYQGRYSSTTNSPEFAVLSSDDIYIYSNKNLSNPSIIPHDYGYSVIDHFLLTDNNVIAIASSNQYDLINISSGSKIDSLVIDDYPVYSKWSCLSTSKDGEYFCVVTRNGIKYYNIGSGIIVEQYSDTRNYRSVYFNEYAPEQLFLTFTGSRLCEIRNSNDFSLIKSFELPTSGQVLRNIDPISGNLLTTDYMDLYIINPESAEVVLQIGNVDAKPWLFANRLWSDSGYTLDLTNYLEK